MRSRRRGEQGRASDGRRSEPTGRFGRLAAALALAVGCAGEAPEETGVEAAGSAESRGIITAELSRYVTSGADEPFEQFGVTGIFARYRPENEGLLADLLGVDALETDLALDTCSLPSPVLGIRERRSMADETAIELVDVGDLSMSFGRLVRPIPTRAFPDLLKVIDGVIYTADESAGIVYLPGEIYTVHATGTDEVFPFDVVLEAPDDLGDVRVGRFTVGDRAPIVRRAEPVEIAWEGEGYGDEVIITVRWTGMGLPWSFACRVRDDGSFVIPGVVTTGLHDPLAAADEEMTVSRVRQAGFWSGGLATGTFGFVMSTNFPVEFEAVR